MMRSSEIRKRCEERHASELGALKKHRASGGKVAGYTCHIFPSAVAAGLGLWPLRLLCGSSADAESAGEKIVRPDICPHVKSLLGNVVEQRGMHAMVDLWIGLYTCDQMRRGMDSLSQLLGKEVHPVQLPATRTVEAAQYYADQINRLVSDISIRYKISYNQEAAMQWQKDHAAAGEVLLQAARSGGLSPLDLHFLFHLFFISRPAGLAQFLKETIHSGHKVKPKRTIVLAGSPLTFEDTVLLEIMEERGVSVLPLNCTGLNTVETAERMEKGNNSIRALALSSFYGPACIRARPNTEVYERIRETLETSSASGLIVKCLKFCDLWYTEKERMKKAFNIPVLFFDSDYASGGRERLTTRIDAFLEMLQ